MVVWQRDGVAEWVKGLSLSYCSIKHKAISSITVDIADKTLSCVDLKPLVWQLYYSQWTEGGKTQTDRIYGLNTNQILLIQEKECSFYTQLQCI